MSMFTWLPPGLAGYRVWHLKSQRACLLSWWFPLLLFIKLIYPWSADFRYVGGSIKLSRRTGSLVQELESWEMLIGWSDFQKICLLGFDIVKSGRSLPNFWWNLFTNILSIILPWWWRQQIPPGEKFVTIEPDCIVSHPRPQWPCCSQPLWRIFLLVWNSNVLYRDQRTHHWNVDWIALSQNNYGSVTYVWGDEDCQLYWTCQDIITNTSHVKIT